VQRREQPARLHSGAGSLVIALALIATVMV
jgi:hypothetical protein